MLNKFILILLIPFLLFAEEPITQPSNPQTTTISSDKIKSGRYGIEYFSFKDLSTNNYWVSIVSDKPQEVINELNGENKDKTLRVQIGDIRADIIKDSVKADEDNPNVVNFQINAYYKIPPGHTEIKLFSQYPDAPEHLESLLPINVPILNDQPDKQPFIESISPEGGTRGDTITLKGRNFGRDIDDVTILIYEAAQNKNGEDSFDEIDEKRPFYLTVTAGEGDGKEKSELKFNIPLKKDLMKGGGLRKSLKIRMFVSGRPSNFVGLTLLPEAWKIYSGFLGFILTILFLIALYWIMRKLIKNQQEKEIRSKGGIKRPSIVHFFELILTDRVTNTYSLSKFQAFVWTIAAIGSYSYVIISQGLLLRNGKIPDFNPSLIILMSISYGGLIAAGSLGSKKPKNEVKAKPPQLSNLFCEGGSVDLSRLQLFGFTLVAIAAYLYNLALGNPLEGLPDIPPTLLTLMGVSQTGYIGNKAVGKESTINTLSPGTIEINQSDIPITILGSGFVKDMKVIVEGYSTLIPAEFKSPSELSFIMPKLNNLEIGQKIHITIQPPTGAQLTSNIYLEVVDVGMGGQMAPSLLVEESDSEPTLSDSDKAELDAYKEDDKS